MFKVTALPASYGDCLWIQYGTEDAPHVVLIDAGPSAPAALKDNLEALKARGGVLELVVVTHVDADHIGGMITLLKEDFYGVKVRDFWFNGFRHLPGEAFGEKQGETLTGLILEKRIPWNAQIANAGFVVDDLHVPPEYELPGGAMITLLSPDATQLRKLKKSWINVCGEADLYADLPANTKIDDKPEAFGAEPIDIDKLADEEFEEDTAVANGSSIAFIFEYRGKRILCGADAFPSRLLRSLAATGGERPYAFDLVKIPHHGSANNISPKLIETLVCSKYLFSSNGAKFKHPAQQAVARVIKFGKSPELHFNYKSEFNEIWENDILQGIYPYTVHYGSDVGISLNLL